MREAYEIVIGLEVHAELKTKSKVFCACPTDFGAPPNTQCCPVCMGLPGALPVLNRRAVELAVTAGLALGCKINTVSRQARKNYFYPDLPKGYQISQAERPFCEGGRLWIGEGRSIGITRIHLEEDAGKLIHEEGRGTLIDHNRCGVPLIEIVSEPELRSAEEAKIYLQRLRSILRYCGVSDGRMNEGSLRCDVNLSVRRKGESALGVRTEMKNLNSFSFVGKAIEYEAERQISVLESGGRILQETRRFDPDTGRTEAMRVKENAEDYRYFPEPDLPPVILTEEEIRRLRREIPCLPDQRKESYIKQYGIPVNDAELLVSDRALADYFEEGVRQTSAPRVLANLLISDLLSKTSAEDFSCPISPRSLAELANLMGNETVNSSTAKKLLSELWDKDQSPSLLVKERNLAQINDRALLREKVKEAIGESPKAIEDYKKGKTAVTKSLIGRVMAKTGGRANPTLLATLLDEELNNL